MQVINETIGEFSNSQAVALFYESKAEIVDHVDVYILTGMNGTRQKLLETQPC